MKKSLTEIRGRIECACAIAGRPVDDVTLIAVSKGVSIEAIAQAYDLGVRDFGESRLQEAEPKIEALPTDIRWHFIGSLQSNKARRIAALFDSIHTLASRSALDQLAKSDAPIDCFIEVNIAEEPQKSGVSPKSLEEFVDLVLQCNLVHLRGLMTIGPDVEPEAMRPYFRRLRGFSEQLHVTGLSMGMSRDFEVAIQEGSTHVRVGSALFGARR